MTSPSSRYWASFLPLKGPAAIDLSKSFTVIMNSFSVKTSSGSASSIRRAQFSQARATYLHSSVALWGDSRLVGRCSRRVRLSFTAIDPFIEYILERRGRQQRNCNSGCTFLAPLLCLMLPSARLTNDLFLLLMTVLKRGKRLSLLTTSDRLRL